MQNQNFKRCPSLPIGGLTQPVLVPYRNGVGRPVHISIGIILAPLEILKERSGTCAAHDLYGS
jgi:hypothetical protein